jgi:hypothetical protein
LLTELNVPWGLVPGYLDFDNDITQTDMILADSAYELSASKLNRFKIGKNDENMHHQFTYMIPVESQAESEDIVSRIWFFGTGRDDCLGMGGMDCIRRDQIEWFKHESEKIDKSDVHKSNGIAFMSSPLQEHMYLVNNFSVRGNKRDYSSCQALNTGFFAAAK